MTSGSIARILGLGRAPWRDGLPCPGGAQDTRARIGQRKSSNHAPAPLEDIVDLKTSATVSLLLAVLSGSWAPGWSLVMRLLMLLLEVCSSTIIEDVSVIIKFLHATVGYQIQDKTVTVRHVESHNA